MAMNKGMFPLSQERKGWDWFIQFGEILLFTGPSLVIWKHFRSLAGYEESQLASHFMLIGHSAVAWGHQTCAVRFCLASGPSLVCILL